MPGIIPRGEDAVVTAELPENGTLVFNGWTPDLNTMDPVYHGGDILPWDSGKTAVVLYALWDLSPVPEPIRISFEANGVREAYLPADVWFERGSWLQLESAVAPYGSVYTFRGWSEDPAAEEPEYLAGTSYYFVRNTVLYAVWGKQDALTLTFRDSLPGSASGIPDPIRILPSMSQNVRIPDGIPEKPGMVFIGWNTAADGSGKNIAPGTVFTVLDNTTLWAQWKLAGDSWYVIYNANGGTWAPPPEIVPRGQDAVLTDALPESGSMLFKGWAVNPDAAAAEYMPGDILPYVSGKNVVVLHALWNLSPVSRPVCVSFDANGVPDAGLPADI